MGKFGAEKESNSWIGVCAKGKERGRRGENNEDPGVYIAQETGQSPISGLLCLVVGSKTKKAKKMGSA